MDFAEPIDILMIDDDAGDVHIVQEALQSSGLNNSLRHEIDPREAVAALKSGDALPHLILLDLNMPGMSGMEVLAEIRESERLRHLPVVILTTSDADADVLGAYKHHANCYVTKPVKFQDFVKAVQDIEAFWTKRAKIPRAI